MFINFKMFTNSKTVCEFNKSFMIFKIVHEFKKIKIFMDFKKYTNLRKITNLENVDEF